MGRLDSADSYLRLNIFSLEFVDLENASFTLPGSEYPPSDIYYMNQQGNKLVDAALFTIYLFILFTFTSWLWYKNFETKRFVILKTLFSAIFMCAFFLFLSYLFLQFRSYNSDKWELTKSEKNIAVVLGAAVWSDNQPSPSLSHRVDKAIDLADRIL